jgi:hypothetical protein
MPHAGIRFASREAAVSVTSFDGRCGIEQLEFRQSLVERDNDY